MMVSNVDLDHFRTRGFFVLRDFFDPRELLSEFDRVFPDEHVSSPVSSYDGIHYQYVPMMTAQTPASLSLLDRTGLLAEEVLGGAVLPTRAKAIRYFGNTAWHVDSVSPIESIGFMAYLEPLTAGDGALRVVPGSHRPALGSKLRGMGATGMPATALPSEVLSTRPGDMILIEEHLFHASCGGKVRRQRRVDYLRDPVDRTAEQQTKAYFSGLYAPDWDAGYDVDVHSSYGPDWQASQRPCVARLQALGVYELATRQEMFTRAKRPTR